MRAAVLYCLITGLLTGCAGPMTPFGAVNGSTSRARAIFTSLLPAAENGSMVNFQPSRQVLHTSTDFSVIIEDPQGIPENFEFNLVYNGQDVTPAFMESARQTFLDDSRRQLKLTSLSLRLPPEREHLIYATYRRGLWADAVTRQFAAPTCSMFEKKRGLASVGDFKPAARVMTSINRFSGAKKINPYFVAALIAQESSFDPRAVSSGRALGLTQITARGEGEVIKRKIEWPRHPEVNKMSLFDLRMAVLNGKIHAGNEWRLDPELSIQGGVEYLDYIAEYWRRPDKRERVDKFLGATDLDYSDLILASYNAGPARVSEALERDGAEWLMSGELREARRYVRRVSSYCSSFAELKENHER